MRTINTKNTNTKLNNLETVLANKGLLTNIDRLEMCLIDPKTPNKKIKNLKTATLSNKKMFNDISRTTTDTRVLQTKHLTAFESGVDTVDGIQIALWTVVDTATFKKLP